MSSTKHYSELVHSYSFENGVQASPATIERWRGEILNYLENHKDPIGSTYHATGNAIAFGFKHTKPDGTVCIDIKICRSGYLTENYELKP